MTDQSRESQELVESRVETEKAIRCLKCGYAITGEKDSLSVHGGFRHTFVNPGGYVYTIGCFQAAPGCMIVGEGNSEHTWFPGYIWRLAICGSCATHLGWSFVSGGGDSFYGLIIDQLSTD